MLHYFKFRQELLDPRVGRDVYVKRGKGRGWPEECPPVRAANGFGFDLLANFDLTFTRAKAGGRGGWRVKRDVVISSDFDWSAEDGRAGRPLTQQYAWFWEKGQKLPHPITDNVYKEIANQVKVSSFLFVHTDANELLYVTDVPNLSRPWRCVTALIDTDWYPASYPWHTVIELDADQKQIKIKKGEPLCRVVPVRRDTYFAQQMSAEEFDTFYERGQAWLRKHGRGQHDGGEQAGTVDITRTYGRQQIKSRFVVR